MKPWPLFLIGSLVLTLLATGGLLLHRRKLPVDLETAGAPGDARILYLLAWLASLSILAYLVFAFGRR
jgi:hypothetical protein